jgi:N-acetylmuramoyl-L-alanine amidase
MRPEPPPLPVAPPRTRIVIDPGHGGKDPGGRGKHTTDREVAFAVARELKALLAQDPRIEAIFTRDDDRFVSLEDRLQFTRAAAPAAFVSLHANEFRRKARAFGVEVSYPSDKLARRRS